MKNFLKFSVIIVTSVILFIFGLAYLRQVNESSVQNKYNLECFAGCRDTSKCPIIPPYFAFEESEIDQILADYNWTQKQFSEAKNRCGQ